MIRTDSIFPIKVSVEPITVDILSKSIACYPLKLAIYWHVSCSSEAISVRSEEELKLFTSLKRTEPLLTATTLVLPERFFLLQTNMLQKYIYIGVAIYPKKVTFYVLN